jgi:predicted nucleic acid-binding protein
MQLVLIDSGPLVAYYNKTDQWHAPVKPLIESSTCQFVTTLSCVTEVMWLLHDDIRVKNEFLSHIAKGGYRVESLTSGDFLRIIELNLKYEDMRADFPDLGMVAIAERLDIKMVLSLDKDFDIYRRFGTISFERISIEPRKKSKLKMH